MIIYDMSIILWCVIHIIIVWWYYLFMCCSVPIPVWLLLSFSSFLLIFGTIKTNKQGFEILMKAWCPMNIMYHRGSYRYIILPVVVRHGESHQFACLGIDVPNVLNSGWEPSFTPLPVCIDQFLKNLRSHTSSHGV